MPMAGCGFCQEVPTSRWVAEWRISLSGIRPTRVRVLRELHLGTRLKDIEHDGLPFNTRFADLNPVADRANRLLDDLITLAAHCVRRTCCKRLF